MENMTFSRKQMKDLAKACELAARLRLTVIEPKDDAPEDVVLCISRTLGNIDIHVSQLTSAARIMSIIYNAHLDFFIKIYGTYLNKVSVEEDEEDSAKVEEVCYELNDIRDAMNLGFYAKKAGIEASVPFCEKNFVLRPPKEGFSKDFSMRDLGLASRIFEAACDANGDFQIEK